MTGASDSEAVKSEILIWFLEAATSVGTRRELPLTDLTDEQWKLVVGYVSESKPGRWCMLVVKS